MPELVIEAKEKYDFNKNGVEVRIKMPKHYLILFSVMLVFVFTNFGTGLFTISPFMLIAPVFFYIALLINFLITVSSADQLIRNLLR